MQWGLSMTWQAAAGKRGYAKSILFVTMYFGTEVDIADAVRQPAMRGQATLDGCTHAFYASALPSVLRATQA